MRHYTNHESIIILEVYIVYAEQLEAHSIISVILILLRILILMFNWIIIRLCPWHRLHHCIKDTMEVSVFKFIIHIYPTWSPLMDVSVGAVAVGFLDDPSVWKFPTFLVWYSNHGHVCHRRMAQQERFQFGRRHLERQWTVRIMGKWDWPACHWAESTSGSTSAGSTAGSTSAAAGSTTAGSTTAGSTTAGSTTAGSTTAGSTSGSQIYVNLAQGLGQRPFKQTKGKAPKSGQSSSAWKVNIRIYCFNWLCILFDETTIV